MTLDGLIEALQDLKQSGKQVSRSKVYFEETPINSVRIDGDNLYEIILSE